MYEVRLFSIPGHRCRESSSRQSADPLMNSSLTGRARRLVIRKLTGNERKCSHTTGAVKSWQEMLSEAAFQHGVEQVYAQHREVG